jgi:hypothetical protein
MSDWIGIGVILFLLVCGVLGLARLSRPYEVSTEEFERRAHESPSLMSVGMAGLQKILDPAAGKAMEAQEDFKQGYYDGEQESGDKPDSGDWNDNGRVKG